MKSFTVLLFAIGVALFSPQSWGAGSACEGYSPKQLSAVFETAIQLNQRFKQLAKSNDSDNAAYTAARMRNSEFAEVHAIPCLDRATNLLLGSKQQSLFGRVLALADSYENIADESVSETLALLYVARTDDFETLLTLRSRQSRAALLKRTKEGLERQGENIAKTIARDRAKRLENLIAAR